MSESDALSIVSSVAANANSTSALRTLKDRSLIRRKLLAQTLGVQSPNDLPTLLGTSRLKNEQQEKRNNISERNGDLSDFNSESSPPFTNSFSTAAASLDNRRRDSTPLRSGIIAGGNLSSISSREFVHDNLIDNSQAFIIAKRLTDSTGSGGGAGGGGGAASNGGEQNKSTNKRRKTGEHTALDSDGDEIIEPFDDYFQVLQEEEKVYRGSATFLKGTQSANPHNDYCQHFIDTGQRPQNFIRDSGLAERFDEYPKLKELIKLKDELVSTTATPPMYLKCDLHTYDLRDISSRFDVILIEPPLEENHISGRDCWSWDQIERLDIASVADTRAFIWLWCGSTPEALQRGRDCLKRWGFRRCEDICWVKTNKSSGAAKDLHEQTHQGGGGGVARVGAGQLAVGNSLLQRTKEHCLMGIRGTVRRSNDGDFIHANVDIDLIITEEPKAGSTEKPLEIVLIAEHFCLGRRRLHLFGRDDTLRPGWVTVGPELTSSNFDANRYRRFFDRASPQQQQSASGGGGYTTGCTDRIELLRPKSPVPMDKRGGGGMMMMGGRGGGGGGGNMGSRSDGGGGGGNSWPRGGNVRDFRTRGGNGGGGNQPSSGGQHYFNQQYGHQKTPPLQQHDYDRDQRSNRGGNMRNGMTMDRTFGGGDGGGGGRTSDRYSNTRYQGSQRGGFTNYRGRNFERDSAGNGRRNF